MICRIWRGWTTPQNADAYESLLRTKVIPGILARRIEGFHGIELLRREAGDEFEFVTLMRFSSMKAVKDFAGPQWEVAVVPPEARAVLKHFDAVSLHYEVREARKP